MDKHTIITLSFAAIFVFMFIGALIEKARGRYPDTEETERVKREAAEQLAIMAILGSLNKRK
jgi:hypothetical protein